MKMTTSLQYKVERVSSQRSNLGEGPHWDNETQSLYYVGIHKNAFSIHRLDTKENKTYSANIEVGIIQWDGQSSEAKLERIVFEVENSDSLQNSAFNDGKADPFGRIYCGTVPHGAKWETFDDIFKNVNYTCGLYRYDVKNGVVQVRNNVRLSNGLAWNLKKNKFYYVDSCDLNIKEFDYDPRTGDISNERIVIDFVDNDQRPNFLADGMTIDTNGNLYVAAFNSSKVLKINPTTGKIELEINLPSKQVTSVTFGGENLDVLYVSSGRLSIFEPPGEGDGYMYRVTGLGVKGFDGVQANVTPSLSLL